MKILSVCALCFFVLMLWSGAHAKTVDEYVQEASGHQQSGDLAKAYSVMEGALTEHPGNATICAYMGLYKGMQAGAAQNMMEAGNLSNQAFILLDRAVGFDSLNAHARLYRGLMGVKVPTFLGKLDGAIRDLEWVLVIHDDFPQNVSADMLTTTYDLLAEGYQKQGNLQKTEAASRKVIELAPGSDLARAAEQRIASLAAPPPQPEPQAKPQPEAAKSSADAASLIGQAEASIASGDYAAAQDLLRAAIAKDSTNAVAYRLLATAIITADRGYDRRIAEDTTQRTNLVFDSMRYLDKAVELAPDDMESRLLRGIMGVQFPFFVGKLDQGIVDLEMIAGGNAPAEMKAQAKYYLGFGYQKKGTSLWTQVVNENADSNVVRLTLASMQPVIQHFDRTQYAGAVVMVNFVLGFRDELAPQTAVWVEDAEGRLVRTLYISGFSGHAKQVQVVLPVYAAETGYADADAVTGASIDVGNHIYVWDLKDAAGKPVVPGEYTIKVEVTHWPSYKYQLVTTPIAVGGKETSNVVREGDYIPYLEVRYLP